MEIINIYLAATGEHVHALLAYRYENEPAQLEKS